MTIHAPGKPPVSQSGVVRHPKHAGETCEPSQNSEGFFAQRRGLDRYGKKEIAKRGMSLGGHIVLVGLAKK
ncbi:MAG TPA: hypothetical protein VEH06_02660, partial [Candidatus Bathyarchaeia archaeon]|nr:hypothetical protein [Candidatus Bathyarchaeia archaeon]